MSNNQTNKVPDMLSNQVHQDDFEDEINLIDLLYPIYKRRRFLAWFCVGIALAIGIISIFLPRTYQATAVILPQTSERSGNLTQSLTSTFLEQFGISGLISPESTPSAVFQAVLKGNELALDVLDRYDYFSIMGIKRDAEKLTAKRFAGQVNVTSSKTDKTITVSIQSPDPVFAADMANSYVRALDRYNRTNSYTSARYLREYIEKRMNEADKELDIAQQELRDFQEKNRAVSISEQAKATLEVLADMEAKRVSIEVEKAAKEKFYKGPHREIEQLEAQMEALQKNIDHLTYSEEATVPVEMEKGRVEFYIPLSRIPALNFDESKLLLKVKAKTGVVTMLTTQLEQARLDEAKDIPTINFLEWADPPGRPVKPRIKMNIMLGFIVALFLGIFIIFFMEFMERMEQDPETAPKWLEMKKGIAGLTKYLEKFKQYLSVLSQSTIVKKLSQIEILGYKFSKDENEKPEARGQNPE
jgi:tyrosine-protein kinase Etk/Wzc